MIVHRIYQQTKIFPIGINVKNLAIGISGIPIIKPFQVLVVSLLPDYHTLEQPNFLPLWIYNKYGSRHDNITDWALQQFCDKYANVQITKIDIFNYVYAVLHDPRYLKKFALNLKIEFPRIPFHPNFFAWANIGAQLIKLHAYFEQVEPWPLQRVDVKTSNVKTKLKADKVDNKIEIDTQTTLIHIPTTAWQYQLGNRSALEWVLDQYKEKMPKDPIIREQFNTYRFADYKEQVIELLGKICRVSVETVELIQGIEQLTW
jgi:predicted helicase